jgi:NAD(P)-dependent dehydrogenase (short-subunit alcohol dehydrogenase family)
MSAPSAGPFITGKIALVTGASRGIGRAIAQRLAAAGATVIVTARSLDQAKVAAGTLAETVALIEAAGGKAFAFAADLEDSAQRDRVIGRAVELAGGLDILVNNAGYADYAPVETMSMDTFERTVDHYFRIPFRLCQDAIPVLKARGAGWIVNVGSVTAMPARRPFQWMDLQGGMAAYSGIKAALNRFSESLAAELLASNIAVNIVGPSTSIRTPGASRYIPDSYEAEPIEYIAETALALCHLPARERTGLLAYSLHFPLAYDIPVHSLDGKTLLSKPVIPPHAHPALLKLGNAPAPI